MTKCAKKASGFGMNLQNDCTCDLARCLVIRHSLWASYATISLCDLAALEVVGPSVVEGMRTVTQSDVELE